MALVVGVAVLDLILKAALKDKFPNLLGYILMGSASLAAIVGAAVTSEYKAIPLGVAGVIGTIIFIIWPKNAKISASADDDSLGATVTFDSMKKGVEDWRWWVICGTLAASVVATIFIPQPSASRSNPEPAKRHVEPKRG